jgi:uncharacterized protein (DUF488 family)
MQERKVKPVTTKEAFFTIGYQGHSVDSLICSLNANRVGVLLDVRENPWSRKPGFSKQKLQAAMEVAGIAYIHEPRLGTPSRIRNIYRETGDAASALMEYGRYLRKTPDVIEGLVAMASGKRVCLLCLESDHNMCHRGVIAQRLSEMTKWKPTHLT